MPATEPVGVPAAVTLARQLLTSARALGRPSGTYLLDDLALEHQMSVDSPARRHLAAQVRPMLAHPDLLPTLRCWLDRERNRRDTAEQLHIHPNTLDKRLHRIGQLTGIDASTTRGLALPHGALVALGVESHLDDDHETAGRMPQG